MNSLTREQVDALRVLSEAWPGPQLGLIGATALGLQLPGFYRRTFDLDLSVAIGVSELGAAMGRIPGWVRDRRIEHRFRSPGGVDVDIIPASQDDLARGMLTWSDGREMSLLGMRHAIEGARPLVVAPGLEILVATVRAIFLLKTVSYLERPEERERDLGDMAFILAHLGGAEDERKFSDEVRGLSLDFETSGYYLLGCDLASIVDDDERARLEELLDRLRGSGPNGRARAGFKRQAPKSAGWHDDEQLDASLTAFQLGLARRR